MSEVQPLYPDGLQSCRVVTVDDANWYPVTTYWRVSAIKECFKNNQPMWLEASPDCPSNVVVLNSIVAPPDFKDYKNDVLQMDILVKAEASSDAQVDSIHAQFGVEPCGLTSTFTSNDTLVQLRPMDGDCVAALEEYKLRYRTRQADPAGDPNRLTTQTVEVSSPSPEFDFADLDDVPPLVESDKEDEDDSALSVCRLLRLSFQTAEVSSPSPQVSAAKYKAQDRTNRQAQLFPELEKEIADRRKRLNANVRDQKSATYRKEICDKVKELGLCPPEPVSYTHLRAHET